ncbi:MAG: DUF1566 domain-containing protein [Georgfuchsia sp.]
MAGPSVAGTTSTATTLSVTINENGTGYYLVQAAAAAAPSVAAVQAGSAFAMTANVAATQAIDGLAPSTAYKIWFVARDAANNVQASVQNVALTTTTPAAATGLLNDTGITASQCYQAGSDTLVSCASAAAIALSPTQDGMVGRDANPASNDNADGKLGFSFTKIGMDGAALAIQNGTYDEAGSEAAGTHWNCVVDNVTGLMWEVKTADGGLRDLNKSYTNYDDVTQAQKYNGTTYVNPTQAEIDAATNTVGFVAAVNALTGTSRLCGATDWRLPTPDELQGIVDYSVAYPGPTIDGNWFPNTQGWAFWSSSPNAGNAGSAWSVHFYVGYVDYYLRYVTLPVRLVRAGQ